MAKKVEKGIIKFSYESDTLFDEVRLLSAYMTKNLATESGLLTDEYCITEDERDIYDQCLKNTLPNVYEVIIGLVPCVDESISDSNGVSISLVDNHAYNVNVLTLVDSTIDNCLKYGVLAEYYSICTHAELYKVAKDKLDTNLFQLKQRLFQLKKKSVSSQL